jgi:AAA15 family ATPase/GTPase
MGEGFQNVVTFAIAAVVNGHGVVLIDEIENGVYYAALEPFWRTLHRLCVGMNTQIVATTHSLECVEAAARAVPKGDLLVHRFNRAPDSQDVVVASLDSEMLEDAREMALEVR